MFKEKIWFPFIKRNWKRVILLIVAGFIANYLTLLLTLSIGKYFQLMFSGSQGKSKALQLLGIHLASNYIVFFVFFSSVLIARFLFTWLYNYSLGLFGNLFASSLRAQLFSYHLQAAQSKTPNAGLLLAYTNEAKTLQRLITHGIIGFTKEVILIAMVFYLLFAINYQLTFLVVLLLSFSYFILSRLAKAQKPLLQLKNKSHASLLSYISKLLNDVYNPKENYQSGYTKKDRRYRSGYKKMQYWQSLIQSLAPTLLYSMFGLIMFAIYYLSATTDLEKKDLPTYLLLLLSAFPVIRNIIKIQNTWTKGKLSAAKFYRIKVSEEVSDTAIKKKQNDLTTITLNHVSRFK